MDTFISGHSTADGSTLPVIISKKIGNRVTPGILLFRLCVRDVVVTVHLFCLCLSCFHLSILFSGITEENGTKVGRNVTMISLGLMKFPVYFVHLPIGSMLKLCTAVVAIFYFFFIGSC
jgi:hypothetical protein